MDTNNIPAATQEEMLRDIFLGHPETHMLGKIKFLGYNWFRGWKYGLEKDETLERSEYENGPLTMQLIEITCNNTDDILRLSVRIADAQHGASESKYITEVDYLKQVLAILDEEKSINGLRQNGPRIL